MYPLAGMLNGSSDHLMVVIMKTILLVQKLMQFTRTRPDLTARLDMAIGIWNYQSKSTHVKHGLLS